MRQEVAGGVIEQVVLELERGGIDLRALGMAWARAAPVVAIVPAFGLRALPGPVRALMGLCLAACIAPAVYANDVVPDDWLIGLLGSAVRGIPVAISAAIPLWAATVAGGVVDAVRRSNDFVSMPPIEGRPTVFGAPMALLASAIFLGTGAPARVVTALAQASTPTANVFAGLAYDIAGGVQIAVAVAAPVLAASVVVEVAAALMARAAAPAQIHVLLLPLRAFAVLAVAALTLERMVGVIASVIHGSPSP